MKFLKWNSEIQMPSVYSYTLHSLRFEFFDHRSLRGRVIRLLVDSWCTRGALVMRSWWTHGALVVPSWCNPGAIFTRGAFKKAEKLCQSKSALSFFLIKDLFLSTFIFLSSSFQRHFCFRKKTFASNLTLSKIVYTSLFFFHLHSFYRSAGCGRSWFWKTQHKIIPPVKFAV